MLIAKAESGRVISSMHSRDPNVMHRVSDHDHCIEALVMPQITPLCITLPSYALNHQNVLCFFCFCTWSECL